MANESRRCFLQKAIAGVSVGTTAPALLGHEQTDRAAANERIGIGCVGVGGRAGSLLRMLAAQEDVDVVALADIDARRIPEAVAMVNRVTGKSPDTHGDFRRLLDNASIDVLVVGTPDHWHAIPTLLGCLAGKDVYVEKPDGHNMLEGQRMVEAMRKNGRIVQMGTQSRTSAHFHSAIEFIRSGRLGAAVEAQGGMLPDLPAKVSAAGGKWYFDDIQEWPDTLQVTYEYSSSGEFPGRILTYEMRIWAPYKYMDEGEGVILYGDQASIVIGNRRWRAYSPDGEVLAKGSGSNDGASHIRNFLDCVKSRERPNEDLETVGHPSSVLCHAGNVAWRVGKTLQLDPKTEMFDNVEANALRTRTEYRQPWVLPDV